MEHNHSDVHDSTDWLSTPLSGLAAVEAALRCQVCKDFYKTPMLTSCAHTFCSLCIRRALSNDGKCPVCRASEQELKLRSNWSMEEVVEAFVKSRTAVLDFAKTSGRASRPSPKRKLALNSSPSGAGAPESKRLRSSARLGRAKGAEATAAIMREESEVPDSMEDEDEDPTFDDDGLVPCPVCQNRMKPSQVNKHLDSCLESTERKSNGEGSSKIIAPISLEPPPRPPAKSIERLPALNYSMLKEPALRKKLSELGISAVGSRQLLEKRHKEYITIWNANCDSTRPKKRSELLRDLDVWERTQGGRVQTFGQSAHNTAVLVKDKDFDGAAWASKHDTSFKDLIAAARKTRLDATKTADKSNPPIENHENPGAAGETDKLLSSRGQEDAQFPNLIDLTAHQPDVADVEMTFQEKDSAATRHSDAESLLPDQQAPSQTYFLHDGFSDHQASSQTALGASNNKSPH